MLRCRHPYVPAATSMWSLNTLADPRAAWLTPVQGILMLSQKQRHRLQESCQNTMPKCFARVVPFGARITGLFLNTGPSANAVLTIFSSLGSSWTPGPTISGIPFCEYPCWSKVTTSYTGLEDILASCHCMFPAARGVLVTKTAGASLVAGKSVCIKIKTEAEARRTEAELARQTLET